MNRYLLWYLVLSFVLMVLMAGWLAWEDIIDRRKGRPRDHKFGYHFGRYLGGGHGVGWIIVCAFAPFINLVVVCVVLMVWMSRAKELFSTVFKRS